MQVKLIGIDLAKSIFQVCGVNQAGNVVFNRAVRRNKLLAYLAQYPDATIAMEACSGSNYWGRTLIEMGYKVMLIPPQHVKPFVKGNKNDRNDSFAITEAANRPEMVFVQPRSLEQTDIMLVHRRRERLVEQRTALINQIRGFLSEYGVVVAQGKRKLFSALPSILEEADNGLTTKARQLIHEQFQEWRALDEAIDKLDKQIHQQALDVPAAKRLTQIKGVGDMIATAAVAYAGDGKAYRSGRHFSASLGVVPKEHSSGGKQKMGQITKRGNEYLRRLLVQGAWSVLQHAKGSEDRLSVWAVKVQERRGKHKAVVAVANKLARIIWAMICHKTDYRMA